MIKNNFYSPKNTIFKKIYHKNEEIIPFNRKNINLNLIKVLTKRNCFFYKKSFEKMFNILFSVNNSIYLKYLYY